MKAVGVFSVKGGVGKTLIAINLAYRLRQYGRVGLLDTDFDNSNFAQFTGMQEKVKVTKDNKILLPTWNDIKVFSFSILIGRERGVSMTEDRYVQMISDVMEFGDWGDLDYMVIDLPGGSSDIWKGVLTVFSEVLLGDVIVSQPIMTDSLLKGIRLHKYFDIPIIGVIDNMSYITCPHGEKVKLFANEDVRKIVETEGVEYLGEIPFIPTLPEQLLKGNPIIETDVLDRTTEKIVKEPVRKTSFIERFKEATLKAIKTEIEKILAYMIVRVQKEVDLSQKAVEAGFTEQKPFILTITDEDGGKIITRIPMKIKNGKLIVLNSPEKIDFEIVTSFRTLARALMGKARRGDKLVDYSIWDAWASGDIRTYGSGFTPRAIRVLEEIANDTTILQSVRERYGSILEKWI